MPACILFNQPVIRESLQYRRLITINSFAWHCVRLKPIDVECMRQLHTKVNLIPIIAKADTLTDEEVVEFKARVCLLSATGNIRHSSQMQMTRSSPTLLITTSTSSKRPSTRMRMTKPSRKLRR